MAQLCTKFEDSNFSRFRNMNEDPKCTIQYSANDFLLTFHRKYVSILYHFRDKGSYSLKATTLATP